MAILSVTDLKARYKRGTPLILKGISFEVNENDFFAIIGPSGAGKSTLIRCINRLVEPESGEIMLYGQDVTKLNGGELRRTRRNIGMIFQEFNLVNRMSVMDNVLSGRLGYTGTLRSLFRWFPRADIQRALELLGRVGLSEHVDKRADELSGGQRQRVGIARALIQNPKLLLLDEPTSALDVSIQAEVLNLLMRLRREHGLTYILVSHNLAVVSHMCERLAVMRSGEIVETLTVDQLRAGTPDHPYTSQLFRAAYGYDPDLVAELADDL